MQVHKMCDHDLQRCDKNGNIINEETDATSSKRAYSTEETTSIPPVDYTQI